MTAEARSIYSGPIRRALDRLDRSVRNAGGNGNEGFSFVIDPAEAGPRSDAPSWARFGNVGQADKSIGFGTGPEGSEQIIFANGQFLDLYERTGGSTFTLTARFAKARSTINGVTIGPHPIHTGYYGVFADGAQAASNYALIFTGEGATTLVNASTRIDLRVGNNPSLYATSTEVRSTITHNFSSHIAVTGNVTGNGFIKGIGPTFDVPRIYADGQVMSHGSPTPWPPPYNYAHLIGYNDTGSMAQMSLYAPGAAAILRMYAANGEQLQVTNSANTAFAPIVASSFPVNSALVTKRGVRSLRPHIERPHVHHDPLVDELPTPDIMALRPVAYRRKVLPQRIVPTGDGPIDPTDDDSFTHIDVPADEPMGKAGRRELLGLVADEVQHILPSSVSYDIDGKPYAIDYAQVTVALLDHVQQLTRTIDTLQYRITELENR